MVVAEVTAVPVVEVGSVVHYDVRSRRKEYASTVVQVPGAPGQGVEDAITNRVEVVVAGSVVGIVEVVNLNAINSDVWVNRDVCRFGGRWRNLPIPVGIGGFKLLGSVVQDVVSIVDEGIIALCIRHSR